jgi:hypothetical protein
VRHGNFLPLEKAEDVEMPTTARARHSDQDEEILDSRFDLDMLEVAMPGLGFNDTMPHSGEAEAPLDEFISDQLKRMFCDQKHGAGNPFRPVSGPPRSLRRIEKALSDLGQSHERDAIYHCLVNLQR